MPNIVTGRQLRAARTLAGLTQSELSTEAGFNPRAAKYWEGRGDELPTCIPQSLDSIEQVLLRHGVEIFCSPTPVLPEAPDEASPTTENVELPAAGGRYQKAFTLLLVEPPAHISVERWQRAVEDGRNFLATWGEQADALGWDSRDLFGLDIPPADPHPSIHGFLGTTTQDSAGCCRAKR